MLKESEFKRYLDMAAAQYATKAVIAIFDLDDDCAGPILDRIAPWVADRGVPFAAIMPRREYEAWFLAGVETLRGRRVIREDATYHANPEIVRGAKSAIEKLLIPGKRYVETADQPAFSELFSLEQAYRRSSSFRKLVKELCRLLTELGHQPHVPANWSV